MGLVLVVTGALALWVVLWSIRITADVRSWNAFLVALGVMVIGVTIRIAARYLPGRRR